MSINPYDIVIAVPEDWAKLAQRQLDVVIDPFVFRIGQFFLEGRDPNRDDPDSRWGTIARDLGALVNFFDLIVLHDQLPAFNYADTFDSQFDVGNPLSAVLDAADDKTVVHVDVEHQMYYAAKAAAIEQLRRRMEEGPFVPAAVAADILQDLTAVEYEWEPSLWNLETSLPDPDQKRIARFLLGQLVFAGYAQQTGAVHVLAPRRSRLIAAVGLRSRSVAATAEADIYRELGRRFADAGDGWRDDELPWSPSFLPYLLSKVNPYRDGPDVLLRHAKELRSSPAVRRYRKLRNDLSSADARRSREARRELEAAADTVASSLDSNRQELELARHIVVEILPKGIGVIAGAAAGMLLAGPPGTAVGGIAGLVGEEALKPVQGKLWGWILDALPFHSARKLLSRSVHAEHDLHDRMARRLRTIWETGSSVI
jgi:hypothetical protein